MWIKLNDLYRLKQGKCIIINRSITISKYPVVCDHKARGLQDHPYMVSSPLPDSFPFYNSFKPIKSKLNQ